MNEPTPTPTEPALEPAAPNSLLGTEPTPSSPSTSEEPAPAASETPAEGAKPEGEAAAQLELFDATKLTLPEGFKAEGEQFEAFKTFATERKLSHADAQALVEMNAGALKTAAEAFTAAQTQAWEKTTKAWVDEIRSDKEIGGEALETKVLPAISMLINEYGGADVRAALDLTGAGNNPALTRFLYKVASALGEGQHVQGNPASAAPKSPAQVMYPTLSKG